LYFDDKGLIVTSNPASKEALKTLHKTIKKVQDDIEGFSFNTSVSQFMIAVNELTAMNCHERSVLEPLAVLISPYAPHIAEELWEKLGHQGSIARVPFPKFNAEYLVESSKEYPVSFNGKMRFTLELPLDLTAAQIEEIVMKDERTIKQLEGRTPNKVIIVPGKIINWWDNGARAGADPFCFTGNPSNALGMSNEKDCSESATRRGTPKKTDKIAPVILWRKF
jgi:leucyl-tRNA synthetase